MILGRGIKVGDSIKTASAWLKVIEVVSDGVKTNAGIIQYGTKIFGWKNS